jgi:putative endonuclease
VAHPEAARSDRSILRAEGPKDLSLHRQMSAYMYIMSNQSHTLYVGSTIDLLDRVRAHEDKGSRKAFTAHYHFNRLVYFEVFAMLEGARAREMEIKGWTRARKVALIQSVNPNWLDLTPRLNDLSFLG